MSARIPRTEPARSRRARRPRLTPALTALLSCAVATLSGCGMVGMPGMPDFGVTTGGAQDIASARKDIEDGLIPDPDAITVEGFLSEHDIPIEPPPNAGLLYSTVRVAYNADYDELTPLATVVIGFGTTLDTEHFRRDSQNLCLVIDRSSSMREPVTGRSDTDKLTAVKIAVDRLLAQLTPDDRVSIVSFSSKVRVDLEPVLGTDIIAIKTALDEIEADGWTDLAGGMRRGYELLADHHEDGRADRLLVFTDALPTAGTRDTEDFLDLMNRFADRDIGATLFGVGVDFGDELAQDISQVRGGNFFFLDEYDRIVSVFDDEFDFLVTPIAYDVSIVSSVAFTWDVDSVYGLPDVDIPGHTVEMTIPTLFLSNRGGGGSIFLRLRAGSLVNFDEPIDAGLVQLTYSPPDGSTVTHTEQIALPTGLDPTGEEPYFDDDATKRAVLLLDTALVLKRAADDAYFRFFHYDDVNRLHAAERLRGFLPYFDRLAEGLPDRTSETSRALSEERALVEQFLANLEGL